MHLYYKDTQLNKGDILTDEMGVEEGTIYKIAYPEVLVIDSGEGWTVSEENDNMGDLEWR